MWVTQRDATPPLHATYHLLPTPPFPATERSPPPDAPVRDQLDSPRRLPGDLDADLQVILRQQAAT